MDIAMDITMDITMAILATMEEKKQFQSTNQFISPSDAPCIRYIFTYIYELPMDPQVPSEV